MKKTVLIVPALMALAAASCTKSEVLETNSGEIRFNVVANKATKADAIYDNSNFDQFTVYASTAEVTVNERTTYINGDVVNKVSGGWENVSGTRFWPETALNFYALRNADDFVWNPAKAHSFDFSVASEVSAQKDLLYAVKLNQARTTTETGTGDEPVVVEGAPVSLHFRHALSQIVFQAKNTNPNLYVEISGVKLVNVGDKGNYTLPEKDTDAIQVVTGDNAGGLTDPVTDQSRGSWTLGEITNTSYEISFSQPFELNGAKDATAVALDGNVPSAMMLIPQKTEAWAPATHPAPDVEDQTGSYLMVNCVIWNVAGESHSDSDLVIWGAKSEDKYTAEPAWVAIPAAFDWKEGFKYIYTFIFNNGGGYDPNPDPDDPDPQPAIIPIDFEVSVDDFNVVNGDVDLDVPEA